MDSERENRVCFYWRPRRENKALEGSYGQSTFNCCCRPPSERDWSERVLSLSSDKGQVQLPTVLGRGNLEPPGKREATAGSGAPTRWRRVQLRAAAPTLRKRPLRPLKKGTDSNPDGVFNFDTKPSTFSLEITYKETEEMNSMAAAACHGGGTSWWGQEPSETRDAPATPAGPLWTAATHLAAYRIYESFSEQH